MQITGIILAGGQSSRMGTDKALLQIDGKTLLERTIELCKPICYEILISSNNPKHEKYGYPIIQDEKKNCGPMGGIYSCLKKSETCWNFVISVDSAFLVTRFIQFLISEIDETEAVIPVHKNGKEPLIALYNKKCLPVIEEKLGLKDYKMHHLLDSVKLKLVNADSWLLKYPEIFKNINFPDDLNF